MGKNKDILFAMEINADDASVKDYVKQRPEDCAELLRKLLAEAQKKIEDLEDEVEQVRNEVEDYRQGLQVD
tara:strand:- start:174 stop:386 length:213 start_codon:yes stop_codon:yes gene_type:complete